MSVASLATTSVVVTRRGAPSGAAGTMSITTVFSGRARIQPLSGAEQQKYSRDTEVVNTKAYIPGVTQIRAGDILSAGSDAYIVRAVRDIDLLGRFTTLEMERQK